MRRLVLLLLALPAALPAPAGAARIGHATVHPCKPRGWVCGSIPRRLDPARRRPVIRIHFRYRRASDGAKGPPLVAVEGGPGYPSGGSRIEYEGMYGPLLRHRDLLLVDNRGTGASALIRCRELQRGVVDTSSAPFLAAVTRCAARVERRHGPGAANRFATAYATEDFEAVLRRLRLRKVDLYGDSYGTFFAQSYLSRHHARVRSVVLDSAYPIQGLDPFYASSAREGFNALARVCERASGCTGSPRERLGELVARLRAAPLPGLLGPGELSSLVQDSASVPLLLRELDAAVTAALGGDPQPLLRLREYDKPDPFTPAGYFSTGLYLAVACTDYPQLFDMTAPPPARPAQLDASFATAPAGELAPFTPREWISVNAVTEAFTACLNWPVVRRVPPVRAPGAAPLPPDVPVLVIGGDLDSLTPVSDAPLVTGPLATRSRTVVVANTFHAASEGDSGLVGSTRCTQRLVRAFVRAPHRLETLDAGCATRVPRLHTPSGYPVTLAAARPADVLGDATPATAVRQAVTVAAEAVADAIAHGPGPGLRGGTVAAGRGRTELRGVRFTADTAVSGSVAVDAAANGVRADVVVLGPDGLRVPVVLSWTEADATASAAARGTSFSLPAP